MNTRQYEILRLLLLKEREYILIRDIAEKISCSEKTIRNDCKIIEAFLDNHYQAKLIRKPGAGISINIEKDELTQLYQFLHQQNKQQFDQNDLVDDDLMALAYQLVMNESPTSIQDLAKDFYVAKTAIKKALELLEPWFAKIDLRIMIRQRIGISLKGSEQNRRVALATLDQLDSRKYISSPFVYRYFQAHELDILRKKLTQFQEKYSFFLTDDSFENITTYLLLMVKRSKMRQFVTITEKEEIYIKEKAEYKWISKFVYEIGNAFNVSIPHNEIIYLSMQMLGAKIHINKAEPRLLDVEMEKTAIDISNELSKRLTIITLIPFKQDRQLLEGLKIHLYTMFTRLSLSLHMHNPLVQDIKKMYPYMFNTLLFVLQDMKSRIPHELPEDEVAYLTLHYQAAAERIRHKKQKDPEIVLVCHLGIGVSEILRSKINVRFPFIKILATLAKRELSDFLLEHNPDLIVTTTPIGLKKHREVTVSPLFTKADENKLMHMFKEQSNKQVDKNELSQFIDPDFVFLQVNVSHYFELIEQLATHLYEKGYVEKDYPHQVLIREKNSATTIGGGIAIPHADPNLVIHSTIAVATLEQPIDWDGEKVSLVFMLAIKNEAINNKELFRRLTVLTEQPTLVESLIKETNKLKFLKNI
ncbi:BglG family transcription antiterminator [Paraliobacillus salinarum]|uniref:BglG family transcription antiterminator n=1 Tax=Paraliobacillus salinarum TaxID=1158996 RepID=UPI0015F680DC|nr:BglG family transcription antiterminator [Paraliobacillus salinarum]